MLVKCASHTRLGYPHKTILGIGVYYVLVAIFGFFTKVNMLLEIIHINAADRWLHVMLAVVILAGGLITAPNAKKISENVAAE